MKIDPRATSPRPEARPEGRITRTAPVLPTENSKLVALVKRTRAGERSAIQRRLDRRRVTARDVDQVLHTLEYMEGPAIGALVRTLPEAAIGRCLTGLTRADVAGSRRETLEVLAAAPRAALSGASTRPLRDMDLADLSPRERYALFRVLGRLSPAQRARLLSSPNGPIIESLWHEREEAYTPEACTADEAHALATEQAEALRLEAEEAQLAAKPELGAAIEEHARALGAGPGRPGGLRVGPAGRAQPSRAAVKAALQWIAGLKDEVALRAAVRRLDHVGVIDPLLQALTPGELAADHPDRGTLHALIAARAPERNLALAESLLNRCGWWYRALPHEAVLAYHLIRSSPLEAQRAFRAHQQGRWLLALEAELEASLKVSAAYRGIEPGRDAATGALVDRAEAHAAVLDADEEALRAELKAFARTASEARGPAEAERMLQILASRPPEQLRAMARRLDALGCLEPLLAAVGHSRLLAEDARDRTLRILAARDPVHLAAHARKLLTTGILHWAIGSDEALFALHILKALPAQERRRLFVEQGGRWWHRTREKLGPELRLRATTNLFGGRPRDRDRLRALLLEPGLWPVNGEGARAASPRLASLIRMAHAAGDGRWVFDASKAHRLDEHDPELCERHQLYHPERRPTYQPEIVRRAEAVEEETVEALQDIGLKIADAILLAGRGRLAEYVGVTGISLGQLGRTKQNVIKQRGLTYAPAPGAKNRLDIRADPLLGLLEIDAPELRASALTEFEGDTKLTTRDVELRGLTVRAHFPTRRNPGPGRLEVNIGGLVVRDALFAGPEAMKGAAALTLEDVHFTQVAAGAAAGESRIQDLRVAPGLNVAVPVLGNLTGTLARIILIAFSYLDPHRRPPDVDAPIRQELRVGKLAAKGLVDTEGHGIDQVRVEGLQVSADPVPVDEAKETAALRRYDLEIGEVALEGVRAGTSARLITARDVRGKGAGAAFGIRLASDARLLEEILAGGGDDLGGEVRPAATGRLSIGAITIEDLATASVVPSPDGPLPDPALRREDLVRLAELDEKGASRFSPEEEAEYVALAARCRRPPALALERLEMTVAAFSADDRRLSVDEIHSVRVQTQAFAADALNARSAGLQLEAGGARIDANAVNLEKVVQAGGPLRIERAAAGEFRARLDRPAGGDAALADVESATVDLTGVHFRDVTAPPAVDAPTARLEPLGGLDGKIVAHVPLSDGGRASQVTLTLPLEAGTLDPRHVTAHLEFEPKTLGARIKNWSSPMLNLLIRRAGLLRIDEEGLKIGSKLLMSHRERPGLHRTGRPNGWVDVRALAESYLNRPEPDPKNAPTARIELAGEALSLGEGRVELNGHSAYLAPEGANRVSIRSTVGLHHRGRSKALHGREVAMSTPAGRVTGAAVDAAGVEVTLTMGEAERAGSGAPAAAGTGAPSRGASVLEVRIDGVHAEGARFQPSAQPAAPRAPLPVSTSPRVG